MSSRITPSIVVPASNNGIWLAKHVLTGQKYTKDSTRFKFVLIQNTKHADFKFLQMIIQFLS